MTNDLVDRTARAIYETFCARLYPNIECIPWDGIDVEYREDLRAEARAAIAMIRPEVLEEAAQLVERKHGYGMSMQIAAEIRAMIQRSRP